MPSTSYQNLHRFKRHVISNHAGLFESNDPDGDSDLGNATPHVENMTAPDITEENVTQVQIPIRAEADHNVNENEEMEKISLEDTDILDLRNKLRDTFLNFSLSLHSKPNFTRKDVIDLQKNITEQIVRPICDTLIKICPLVNNKDINELIEDIYQPFQFISSEQKLNTTLQNIQLNDSLQTVNYKNSDGNITSKGCLMPIKHQFKLFFESGNIFNDTINHIRLLEDKENITNIVNGTLWRHVKQSFKDRCVIPYFLYSDEVEMNDAIGAHSGTHKVTGLYYNFPTIPPHFLARLENLFVAGFVKASDMAKLGPSVALKELIDVLIDLEQNGIELNIDGKTIRAYFVLMAILGDNLGINTLMGYATSFSSMLFCRFCTMNKYDCQKMLKLDPNCYRTIEKYETDVQLNFKESGIKEESAFNKLEYYHVAKFTSVDLMHDFFSHGICNYDMSLVLLHMMEKMHIPLQTINYKIQKFDCKETEKRNTFKYITKEQIKSTNFKMTAREMLYFVHYFPLIFGDLMPENNEVWDFVLSLVELIDIILLPQFNEQILTTLQEQIVYHHTLYKKIFATHLKPKYHILLHYPDIIRKIGPPRYTWSFRFEAFHQVFKKYCRNITSRRNICLTLCTKARLIFMNDIKSLNNFKDALCYKNAVRLRLINLPYFSHLAITNELLTANFEASCTITSKGVEYKVGQFLTKSSMNMKSVMLFEIKDLLVHKNELFVTCQQWSVESYSQHLASFKVINDEPVFHIFNVNCFDGPPIHIYEQQGHSYIRLKKYFM